jgi:hypothetical protein
MIVNQPIRSSRRSQAGVGTQSWAARSRSMTKQPRLSAQDHTLPLLGTVSAIAAIIGCFWFFVLCLSQPTIYPNPGLAAYTPPAGTRLVPLPRESDAPEFAEAPEDSPPPLSAMAQAPFSAMAQGQLRPKEAKATPPVRKHLHTTPREAEPTIVGYAQQWPGDGNRGSSRVPSGPRLTGGPKSWF